FPNRRRIARGRRPRTLFLRPPTLPHRKAPRRHYPSVRTHYFLLSDRGLYPPKRSPNPLVLAYFPFPSLAVCRIPRKPSLRRLRLTPHRPGRRGAEMRRRTFLHHAVRGFAATAIASYPLTKRLLALPPLDKKF